MFQDAGRSSTWWDAWIPSSTGFLLLGLRSKEFVIFGPVVWAFVCYVGLGPVWTMTRLIKFQWKKKRINFQAPIIKFCKIIKKGKIKDKLCNRLLLSFILLISKKWYFIFIIFCNFFPHNKSFFFFVNHKKVILLVKK